MKLTKKQIQQIIDHTPKELKDATPGHFSFGEELGYFMPHDANWSYRAGWLDDGTLVVLRYGTIVTWKI